MPPFPPESPLPLHPTFFELLSQDLDIERLYEILNSHGRLKILALKLKRLTDELLP